MKKPSSAFCFASLRLWAPVFLLLVSVTRAETIWVNDWDSPQKSKGWESFVKVHNAASPDFAAHRDLDGNGRFGSVGLTAFRPKWGVERILAPKGIAFSNIVVTWRKVGHHKPCAAGFEVAVSHTGAFKGEEVVARTPNTTGSSTLRIDLSKRPKYRRLSRLFVRLNGWQNCGWKLSCGGISASADLVDAKTGRKIKLPGPLHTPKNRLVSYRNRTSAGNKCVVEAGKDVQINGYSQIEPEIFSLTAYEGAPDFDARAGSKGIDFCRQYGIEGIGFPANMTWVFNGDWWKKMSIKEIDQWFDSGKAMSFFKSYPNWRSRYVYGSIMPNLRKAGVRPFLYVYGPEPPGPNAAKWIHVSNRYLDLCVKVDPKLKYCHLFGEPNARWFRFKATAKDYAQFFRRWAEATHKRHPHLKLGGPVTYGTPTYRHQWDGWCKTLMDTASKQIDFLDWHSYGDTAEKLKGDLYAVSGYMKQRHGKWIRNALSETNRKLYTNENWHDVKTHYRKRAVPYIKQTFALLASPDKIFSRQVHDYSATAGEYRARFKGNEKLKETPMMWLFKAFKPLRGRRVATSNPFDDVLLEASVKGNQCVVAIANTGPRARTIPLTVRGLTAAKVHRATMMTVRGLRQATVPDNLNVKLPAESLLVVELRQDRPIVRRRVVRKWEYFADDFVTRIGPTGDWQVDTEVRLNSVVRKQAQSCRLRLGIIGGDSKTQEWLVRIGDTTYVVDSPKRFVDISLLSVPKTDRVPISVVARTAPQEPYAVSFVSLMLSGSAKHGEPIAKRETAARNVIWKNDFGTKDQQKNWASSVVKVRTKNGHQSVVQLVNVGKSVWGVKKLTARDGRKLHDLRVEWDVFRATANGADWLIELSPTGAFQGEQLQASSAPGLGVTKVVLDANNQSRFQGVKSVFIRLTGANGPLAWSSRAGSIRLLGRQK